jgi:hypothetical protein
MLHRKHTVLIYFVLAVLLPLIQVLGSLACCFFNWINFFILSFVCLYPHIPTACNSKVSWGVYFHSFLKCVHTNFNSIFDFLCPCSNYRFLIIARTLLEDICDKPIRIQSYCAVARLHGIWEKETEDLLREIEWINCARCHVAPTVQHRPPVIG